MPYSFRVDPKEVYCFKCFKSEFLHPWVDFLYLVRDYRGAITSWFNEIEPALKSRSGLPTPSMISEDLAAGYSRLIKIAALLYRGFRFFLDVALYLHRASIENFPVDKNMQSPDDVTEVRLARFERDLRELKENPESPNVIISMTNNCILFKSL